MAPPVSKSSFKQFFRMEINVHCFSNIKFTLTCMYISVRHNTSLHNYPSVLFVVMFTCSQSLVNYFVFSNDEIIEQTFDE